MWSIAICDDNPQDCDKLEELLECYSKEKSIAMESELFYDGNSLYEKMSQGKRYDLIFLDLHMDGMDGIALGGEIRRGLDDEEVQLVYMSYEMENPEAVIENRPMKFLRKPFRRKRVFQIADYAVKLNLRWEQHFLFHKKRVIYQIPFGEILYFQSSGRKIEIRTVNDRTDFYGKLSDILEKGLPKQFVQIHQSYIINRDFIVKLKNDRVYLKGEKGYFSISKSFRQSAIMRLKKLLAAEYVK